MNKRSLSKGGLVSFTGPSGVGKTTLINKLRTDPDFDFHFSVSVTTRKPRGNEVDGQYYYFRSIPWFRDAVSQGKFLEHQEVHGNFYGTLLSEVLRPIGKGRTVIADFDIKGHASIREQKLLEKNYLSIFVSPTNIGALERMLRGRQDGMSEEQIQRRLLEAEIEMSHSDDFDHVILNYHSPDGDVSGETYQIVRDLIKRHQAV